MMMMAAMADAAGPRALSGAERVSRAIHAAREARGVALVAYVTAGYPSRAAFGDVLRAVAAECDVVEVGVPFSDPMADGVTIQDASRVALADGVTVEWILGALESARADVGVPVVLMSYLNPLLRFGMDRLAERAERAGVCGVIVPDLPYDEAESMGGALRSGGLAMVQMATPVTSEARLRSLVGACSGFVYAVTSTGTTGGGGLDAGSIAGQLESVRAVARERRDVAEGKGLPVCAGFGIRSGAQVAALKGRCDGVIVGSALVEAIGRGEDVGAFLRGLRGG
ncbi:MAG: tryptophan synthase subunit alpha [Phycisphaerales bacterium]